MSICTAILLYASSCLRVSNDSLDSELAFATRVMRESPSNREDPFRFDFLSAFSVPRSRHPRPSDARSPSQNPLRASQEVRTLAPRQAVVPFRRFFPVAEGVGRDSTPSEQAFRWMRQRKSHPPFVVKIKGWL